MQEKDRPKRKRSDETLPFAKELRKNMTPWERHLWYDFLRNCAVKFRRQAVFGKYIADFYCAQAKLVLELDGSQHYEKTTMQYDAERTKELEQYGVVVIRIPNNQVDKNFQGVCAYIDDVVQNRLG